MKFQVIKISDEDQGEYRPTRTVRDIGEAHDSWEAALDALNDAKANRRRGECCFAIQPMSKIEHEAYLKAYSELKEILAKS